jgi:hypothetical protein
MKRWMTAAIGALALALTGTSVQSAPPASGTIGIRLAAQASSSRHQVAYRLCWREGGARQCRWVDSARIYGYRGATARGRVVPRVYGYTALPAMTVNPRPRVPRVYGYSALPAITVNPSPSPPLIFTPTYAPGPANWSNPDAYPTGSANWWRVMDHNERGGQPAGP